jgi:hypothetical protein
MESSFRCLKIGGQEVLDAYLAEQERLVLCAMEQFDLDELQRKIEEKQRVGDLDEVFQEYCRCVIKVSKQHDAVLPPEWPNGTREQLAPDDYSDV